jgi:peptidoglycan/LPS O-acetylase OafA/YrhL
MLLLAARPAVQMLGRRWERGVGWVSRRSLSIYLAGWPAASAARRSANALLGVDQIGSAVWAAVFLALTFAFIVAGTAMIFPVEELARRPVGQWFRSTDTSTVAA